MDWTLGSRFGQRALRTVVGAAFAAVLVVVALGVGQARATSLPTLPGPEFLTGPLDGSTIPDQQVDFSFDVDPSLTGGTVLGFLCSLDGQTFVDCDSPLHLGSLSVGTHSLGVKAVISLLGGTPVCILTVCVDPGPVTVETAVSTTGFTVEASAGASGSTGSTGGTGGSGSNGGNGANGTNGTTTITHTTTNAAAAALKSQQARCKKLRRKLHKHFVKKSNRARVHRRYVRCLKVQRRMARGATVSAL